MVGQFGKPWAIYYPYTGCAKHLGWAVLSSHTVTGLDPSMHATVLEQIRKISFSVSVKVRIHLTEIRPHSDGSYIYMEAVQTEPGRVSWGYILWARAQFESRDNHLIKTNVFTFV